MCHVRVARASLLVERKRKLSLAAIRPCQPTASCTTADGGSSWPPPFPWSLPPGGSQSTSLHPSTVMAWLVGCRHGLARRTPAPQLHKPSMQAPWIGPPRGGEDEEEPALLQPTPRAPFKVVTSARLFGAMQRAEAQPSPISQR